MIRINKIIVDKFCKFFTIYAGGIYKSNCLDLGWILKGFIKKKESKNLQLPPIPTWEPLKTRPVALANMPQRSFWFPLSSPLIVQL